MEIKKVGFLDKIFGLNRKNKVQDNNAVKNDSINISDEAKLMSEINKYKEVIAKLPDVRKEKVEEIKKKLKDESYMSKEVYKSVADKLSDFLGL